MLRFIRVFLLSKSETVKLFKVFLILLIAVIWSEFARYSFYDNDSSDQEISEFNDNIKNAMTEIKFNSFKFFENSKLDSTILSIMVMTKVRAGLGDSDQYFHLTMNSILKALTLEDIHNVSVSVCDLNETQEKYLSLWKNVNISMFRRPISLTNKNIINQETLHYLWCLQQIKNNNLSSSNLLLLEDDVVLDQERFFSILFNTQRQLSNNAEYIVKLYHPPRLLGFLQPEPSRILELFALAVVFHYFFLVVIYVCNFKEKLKNILNSRINIFILFLIWIEIILVIGRWRFLYVRTFNKDLHLIVPAPFCCTPGMVFSNKAFQKITEHFLGYKHEDDFINGDNKVPIDDLLYKYVRANYIPFYYIEPNIIKHIGHISSIRDRDISIRVL